MDGYGYIVCLCSYRHTTFLPNLLSGHLRVIHR
jgi:hypothetical protein